MSAGQVTAKFRVWSADAWSGQQAIRNHALFVDKIQLDIANYSKMKELVRRQ
jgi:hypothetical protein